MDRVASCRRDGTYLPMGASIDVGDGRICLVGRFDMPIWREEDLSFFSSILQTILDQKDVSADEHVSRPGKMPYLVDSIRVDRPVMKLRILSIAWMCHQQRLGHTNANSASITASPPGLNAVCAKLEKGVEIMVQ